MKFEYRRSTDPKDSGEKDLIPTRDEVDQSRRLIEEVRRKTESATNDNRKGGDDDPKRD